jgi:hypothetical protein
MKRRILCLSAMIMLLCSSFALSQINMFKSVPDSVIINDFEVFAGDPNKTIWVTGAGFVNLSDQLGGPAPIEGKASLRAAWTIHSSETWGGNIAVSSTSFPGGASSIDLTGAKELSLWYFNQMPSTKPGLVTFRLKLREAGGSSTFPVNPLDYEEWITEKGGVFDAAPGWNNIRIPLVDRGKVNPNDAGLSLPGWSGKENNGTFDPSAIVGYTLDWSCVSLPGSGMASGTILFDRLEAIFGIPVTNSGILITFRAKLDSLIAAGFDPATDSIVVNGSMNGWSARQKMSYAPELNYWWDTIRYFGAAGDEVQFKFRALPETKFENNGWEIDMPTVSHNRELIVSSNDTTLPEIYPLIAVKPPIVDGVTVTFRVNMNEYLRSGRMMPVDRVMVRGVNNNWDPGFEMVDPELDGIYSADIVMNKNVAFEYKFFLYTSFHPAGGWEKEFPTASKNREGMVGTENLILPVATFDDEVNASISMRGARYQANGSMVTVEGIVTRSRGALTRVQDASAGISVYQPSGLLFEDVSNGKIREGDHLRVSGRITEFRFQKQIDSVTSFIVLSRDNPLPEPKLIMLNMVETGGEFYESELVTVKDLKLDAAGDAVFQNAKSYLLEDISSMSHAVSLRIPNGTDTYLGGTAIVGTSWTFTGVVGQFHLTDSTLGYQLLPVNITDFVAQGSAQISVTFRVNMNEYIRTGRFFPAADSVMLRGVNNNWDPGVRMTDEDNDKIYTCTVPVDAESHIQFKYWVSTPNHASGGWEKTFHSPSGNREVITGAYDITLPVTYFDDAPSLPMLDLFSQNSTVAFKVDMRPAFYFRKDSGYIPSSSGIDSRPVIEVYFNGPISNTAGGTDWAAWGDTVGFMIESRKLHDDGLYGDDIAGDTIFTYRRTFSVGTPRAYIGKLGVNGLDNEAAFGKDHRFNLPDEIVMTVPLIFGAMDVEGTLTDNYGPSSEDPGTYDHYIKIQNNSATVVRSGGYPEEPVKTVNGIFTVNMMHYIRQMKFDPEKDTVFLRATFSNWEPIPMQKESLGVYSLTIPFPVLSFGMDSLSFEYKFWFRNTAFPEGVYEDQVGPGEYGNRRFTYRNMPFNLSTVYFNNESPAFNSGWNVVLTVADKNATMKSLVFGEHPYATDGLDVPLGEADLPPLPPAGILDARFQLPNGVLTSLTDLRDTSDVEKMWSFFYRAATTTEPVLLSWDPTRLPPGNFILKDVITGTLVNVDMKSQSSYVVTNLAVTSLTIEHSNALDAAIRVEAGWNMLSVPVSSPNMSVNGLFPGAVSQAYGFSGGYTTVTSLVPGKGYWLKFAVPETKQMKGTKHTGPIDLPGSWTMIGLYDRDVPADAVNTLPENIIVSQFFGFSPSGYVTVDTLRSGKGYWVKTTSPGTLNIGRGLPKAQSGKSMADAVSAMGKITIIDANNRSKVLYTAKEGIDLLQFVLPPVPPSGIFDVRFRTDAYAEHLSAGQLIDIRSAVFPIRLRVDGVALKVQDVIGGSLLSREMKSGDEIVMTQTALTSLQVKEIALPAEYALDQNYPNPFNPSTTISFSLPQPGLVRLTVYNVLGQEVITMVNGILDAGIHRVEFSGDQLSSNVYFYKIEAGSFTQIKRMMLVK